MMSETQLRSRPRQAAPDKRAKAPGGETRFTMAMRIVVGVFGSYVLAASVALLGPQVLQGQGNKGILLGQMCGLLVYAIGLVWTFATRSLARAAGGIAVSTVAAMLATWVLGALA